MMNPFDLGSENHENASFYEYLEDSGLMEELTRILCMLYEEPVKPANAVDYVSRMLGAPPEVDIRQLQAENFELKRRQLELTDEIDRLICSIEQLQSYEQ